MGWQGRLLRAGGLRPKSQLPNTAGYGEREDGGDPGGKAGDRRAVSAGAMPRGWWGRGTAVCGAGAATVSAGRTARPRGGAEPLPGRAASQKGFISS